MVLIFIYGPAAVGKLTTAKSLSKITGYPIFHNHLSFDLVASIFKFGEADFLRLNDKIRLMMFEEAAKKQIKGLIFTFCYSDPLDNNFIKKTIKVIEKHKSRIFFIHLNCDKSILFERVKNISRQNSGKINDEKKLQKAISKWNILSKISFVDNLEIDNTKLPPEKTALLIKKYYKLK